MYIYIYVCMYVRTYVRTYVCMYTYKHPPSINGFHGCIQITTVKGGLGPANFRSLSALRAPSNALSRTFV